jgi:hypothetical protein
MKKLIIIAILTITLQSCRVCCNGNPMLNTRYLSNCELPTIVKITDVCGKQVDKLSDGVYIVELSNGERIKVIN